MPSVKSYQNRLHDIQQLRVELAEHEYQLRKRAQDAQAFVNEIHRLTQYNQKLMETMYDYIMLQVTPAPIILQNSTACAIGVEVERLKKKVQELEMKLRIYRDYISKTYNTPVELQDALDMVEIPACLKPLDAIEYAANRETPNGESDNQS